MEIKNLVIAPHVDDEILGCGGILNSSFLVYFCGIDESKIRDDKDRTSTNQRFSELKKVADYLGFRFECNESSKVNHYVEQDFIDTFEDLVNKIKPEKIFIPHPGYNQDHRTIFNAAIVALRPHDRNFFVKKILVYEAAHDVIWNPKKMNLNYFVPIDIERKIKAYEIYNSQVRGMRSSQLLMDIASIRGSSSNCKHAEAFEILRWSEDEQ
tara:strand:+ start:406 stop:1038 length:633 start_codon:yes stop_codon:yes gene_type:complete